MYIVEGNIGVGKSTFIKLINEIEPLIGIVTEPVENWTGKEYGQSLLSGIYFRNTNDDESCKKSHQRG